MKIKLTGGFSDLQSTSSPFLPGDEVDIIQITQHCPDLGCCEVKYTIATPDWNDGQPFDAFKYFDKSEIDLSKWEKVCSKNLIIYYPPK